MMWLLWAVVRMAPQKDPGDAADLEAVRRMADGDGQALAMLYDRHSRVTYSLALRILGEPLEAEEVVQDVFSQAWRQAARFDRSRGAVVAWLLMMTRSRAIDRLRSRQPRRDADDPDLDGLPADVAPVSEQLIASQQVAHVREAMTALPMEQRTALELAYFEGLTQTEIAERTQTPLGTVKTRIRTALTSLRRSVRS